jgi:hypothetical protein
MTQTGAALAPEVKQLTVTPLCTLAEAHERFDNRFLDSSHVKVRLTESTHVMATDGETRLLFLKNVFMPKMVERWWENLRQIQFHPASHSRRTELRYSAGGYVQMGWMEFPQRGRGVVPTLTSDSIDQWSHFRALWPLFWMMQREFFKFLPELAQMQAAEAEKARESHVDYIMRMSDVEGCTYYPSRNDIEEELRRLEREQPDQFQNYLFQCMAQADPDYFDDFVRYTKTSIETGMEISLMPGVKNPRAMRGYTVPGSMFSSITINQTAVFRSHEDGNNLDGAFSCLAAFGKFTGGDLCLPRLGVSCPVAPGDLLIADLNREQHGNIGPLMGKRISVVTYMRDRLTPEEPE